MHAFFNCLKEALGDRRLYLWGAAHLGITVCRDFSSGGLKIAGYIDSNPALHGREVNGVPVFAPIEILSPGPSDDRHIVITASAVGDIVKICETFGLIRGCHYSCFSDYYDDWLTPPPPSTIPEALFSAYTLNGAIPVAYRYFDQRKKSRFQRLHNTAEKYKRVFTQLDQRALQYYGREVASFYDALAKYDFKGRIGLVWGLDGCNCEAMALWNRAEKVYVVDYNQPVCDHDQIEVLTHQELRRREIKTDFSFSFSSFEHDGLGRYGDPLCPDGDFEAMRAARAHLTDDGLMFLGVPLGHDCLLWNAGRIYGPRRLPLLLKGWACLDVFNPFIKQASPDFPWDLHLFIDGLQPLLVLGKIPAEPLTGQYLKDLMQKVEKEAEAPSVGTRDPRLQLSILKMCLAAEEDSK